MRRRSAKAPLATAVRWRLLLWPVVVAVVVAAAALVWVWSTERPQRQDQVIPTIIIIGLAAIALAVWSVTWLLFLSRLRWPVRLGTLAAMLALAGFAAVSLEVRGVTGDVMPVVGWRWTASETSLSAPEIPAARAGAATTSPHDFPQFRGPFRDGRVPSVRLAREWTRPPRSIWRRAVGPAWSGFAVAGDFAVTQEQRGAEELVSCYDLTSGSPVWVHADPTRWEDSIGGPGPRATPAVDGGRVYALGGTGMLNALDLVTGESLWSVNVLDAAGASAPVYGVSASPLVVGDTVIVAVGGRAGNALVGYDAANGRRRWAGGDGGPAYGSPIHAVLGGAAQVLVLNAGAVASHDPADGRVLWEFDWPSGTEMVVQPLVLPGDRVFVSTGYGVGGKMLHVRVQDGGPVADLVWESKGLKTKLSDGVHHEGFLYGLDDGILVCLDPDTGERRWKRGRYGHGQLLLVGDLLLVVSERGDVAMVEARPDEHRELGRFSALEGKTWNHPALAGSYLLVRNDREAACFELPLAGTQ